MVDWLERLALAFLSVAVFTSCGGGVSGPAPVDDPSRITILPAISTVYSGTPTTFVISGGTGSYIVTSSQQTVIPVAGAITGNTITVMPNLVIADTIVTLTVRDTGSTPLATATVTVKPGTVNNNITITPTSTQGGNCAPAICSGGDAEVVATLSQGGSPLPARGTRFEVVSGDFFFITTLPGSTVETLATSVVLITDETGKARARIRVPADAPNQTALLQVTDLGTLAFQRASFVILQTTGSSPGFFVSPSSVTFQGPQQNQCATGGISATFFIFGGAAPYTISNTAPTAFFVSPTTVSSSGGSFTVTPSGQCFDGAAIIVRDSSGRTVTVTASNVFGTTPAPALVVSPNTVTLNSCASTANVTVVGGTSNNYFVSSSDTLVASVSGNTVTIGRRPGSPANPGPVNVGVSDGTSVVNVAVSLTGAGAGACLVATPPVVTLTDCLSPSTVTITGGSGIYSILSNSNPLSVDASASGSTVTIRRVAPASPAFIPPATITVQDTGDPANPQVTITVNASGAGAGICP